MAERNDDLRDNEELDDSEDLIDDDDMAEPGDAIAMLEADHRKVRELFQQYLAAGDRKAQRQIAEQVFVELETHAQLEEMVFYPAFEEEADDAGKALVKEAREEHQEVKTLITALRGCEMGEEFDTKFHALMDDVEHHVQEEETEMFPDAEELLLDRSAELAEAMEDIKQQLLTP
jgi:hemerythrin superfamily protein